MSETNKFYQYDRNDNNTFGVRGAASGGGTEVKANETLAGTEDSLTELTVGETKYKVDQPINVVANPTLAGTESALTGVQVGDTKYVVPQPTNVVANPVLTGAESALTGIEVGATKYKTNYVAASSDYATYSCKSLSIAGITYSPVAHWHDVLTTAPSSANTSGYLIFVVLTSEPATYYDGYYYIIAPTT